MKSKLTAHIDAIQGLGVLAYIPNIVINISLLSNFSKQKHFPIFEQKGV